MIITLSNCSLRPWQMDDVSSLAKHANNKNVWNNLADRFPHPYTESDAIKWIKSHAEVDPATDLAITVDGETVGGIGIYLKDDVSRLNAELGYWLAEEYWDMRVMSGALKAFSEYAFETFNILRIYAEVFSKNHASMKELNRAGYVREAILNFSVIKNEEILDMHVYTLLKS